MAAATDNEYDVKAIRGHRYNTVRNREEFLIEWADSDFGENSWESVTNLSDASLKLARKYQEEMENLPPPSNVYKRQARQLLVNTFQRVSCQAIDAILSMCKFNFTRSFYSISVINHQRIDNGDGRGQFNLIPKGVKVFVKKDRQKTHIEITDATLVGELDDISELNLKVAATTKQSVVTPKKSLKPAMTIDLTADSSEDEEEKEEEKECLCCFGDYPVSALKQCSAGENHYVCRECIQRYVSEQLDGNGSTIFKCIVSADCACHYSLAFLEEVLSPRLKKRANERVALEEIKKAGGGDIWQCPKCAYMGFVDGKPTWILCPECNVMYCTCCDASHTGLTCDEFQRQKTVGKDPKHLAAEAMSNACKRCCPHCGQEYLKSDGCNKIRCKCGKLSCYLCGDKIADYSHFCNRRGCACGKCELWTSTQAMERIDRDKRQEAGRKVLLEQGITDEEEIAAILSSLDKEKAAVQGGGARNQGAAAAAVPQNRRVAAPAAGGNRELRGALQVLEEQLQRMQHDAFAALQNLGVDPPAVGMQPAAGNFLGPNFMQGVFGAAAPPNRDAPQVAAAANPQRFVVGAAPNPPAAAGGARPNHQQPPFGAPQPQHGFVAFGAAAAPPQRQRAVPAAQVAAAGNPPQAFAFGAALDRRNVVPNPPVRNPERFVFGAAPNRRDAVPPPADAVRQPNQQDQLLAYRAARAAQRQRAVPAPQVAAAANPPQAQAFAFGAAPNNRRAAEPNPPVAVNQLAENFGAMELGRRGANEAQGGQRVARARDTAHEERLLPVFNRLLSSARVHALEGREREMNNDLARARALAERPGARQNHGITMHYYEAHALRTRRALALQLNQG